MDNGSIKGFLYYTNIQEPSTKFESTEKEWKVSVAVDGATNKRIQKEISSKPKMVPNDEFYDRYKSEVPYPESPIQYVYNIKRSVIKSNGEPTEEKNYPKVLLEDKSGALYDITDRYKVGNGSEGEVNFYISDTRYGRYPGLTSVKVTKLVEFKNTGQPVIKDLPDDVDIASIANVVSEDGTAVESATESPSVAAVTQGSEDAPKTSQARSGSGTLPNDDTPF